MKGPASERIFGIHNEAGFRELAMETFRYQSAENPVYSRYLELIGISPAKVKEPVQIPFLPVEFFRDHAVVSGNKRPEIVFESSGTTAVLASKHHVCDAGHYKKVLRAGFERFYGPPEDYCILALLPSYLERKNSSLAFMAGELIRLSGHPRSGFYLDNVDELADCLMDLEASAQPAILLGVSFALADLAEKKALELKHTLVMETGGMKGRRREMTRGELHELLKEGFGIPRVHSEYGMTELLSQAYSGSDGIFFCPPWMRVLIRDPYDPLSLMTGGRSGGINIVDLANVHSCAFIATQDIGKLTGDGGFEVLGRFDNSDIRGCNLMVE